MSIRVQMLGAFFVPALLLAGPAELEPARKLYQKTDYSAALSVLVPLEEKDGPTWLLIGKCHFMMSDFKRSTEALEQAVGAEPNRGEYHLWLGRAYGRRAETSSFLSAPKFASKARECFERAVALDGANREAINDLFSYYLEAPGFLGGGLGKASSLAERIRQLDPAEYHYAQAKLAEKKKEFHTAEEQFRRAIDLAPKNAGRVLDLAKFLVRRGRFQDSDAVFAQARTISPKDPQVLFEQARAYIQGKRNLEQAKLLLQQYLDSPLTPEDPSRAKAQELLKQLTGGS